MQTNSHFLHFASLLDWLFRSCQATCCGANIQLVPIFIAVGGICLLLPLLASRGTRLLSCLRQQIMHMARSIKIVSRMQVASSP